MEILYILLVLLLVTRGFGELAVRLGQPALVGELTSGIAIGAIVAQYAAAFPILSSLKENEVFLAIADLGVFFLMLYGGIEMRPRELARGLTTSFIIATCGLLLPLAIGFGIGWWFLPGSDYKIAQSLFIGTALAVTAVPVAIRVLMDLGKLESRAGRIIISAAVFDDVLSLVVLAVLTAVVRTGQLPQYAGLLALGGKVLFFFAATFVLAHFVFPRIGKLINRFHADELELSVLLIVAMSFAWLAEALELHFILGAFMAGLFFGRQAVGKKTYDDVRTKVSGITSGFLAPIFFASIGIHMDVSAVLTVPTFVALLVFVAFASKLVGAGLPAFWLGLSRIEAVAVGIGMSARGAVELIIADIALRAGLFEHPQPTPPIVANLFSAVVVVAVVSTVAIPIELRQVFAFQDSLKKHAERDAG
jgi:Kef-type K+ transport system membrane component KefB